MKRPIFESEGNLESIPVFNAGAVPDINPHSKITDVMEVFLTNQIPKKDTSRNYRRNLIQAFGQMAVETPGEIEVIHLVNYKNWLMNDGRGDATHAVALIALRSCLRWIGAMGGHPLRWEQINYLLPVPKYEVIKPHNSLTEKEVGKLLKAAKETSPRDFALILVALGAGLRVSELVHVDVSDVLDDAGGGTIIHVRQGKGSKDRLMPVRKEVRAAISIYLETTGRKLGDRGPLFQSQDRAMGCRESWRLTTKSASRIIRHAVEVAGIEKRVSPHALRHTFAFASYIYSDHDIVAIKNLLGHSSVNTTIRYVSHLDKLHLRKAIPAFLGGGKGPRVRPGGRK